MGLASRWLAGWAGIGLALTGCVGDGLPSFDTEQVSGETDVEVPDIPNQITLEWVGFTNNQTLELAEVADDREVLVVRASTDGDPAELEEFDVLWCDRWLEDGQFTSEILCRNDGECALSGDSATSQRESQITVNGAQLGTNGQNNLEHEVSALLVPSATPESQARLLCNQRNPGERLVRITVLRAVDGPPTEIVPPSPSVGNCHTREESLKAQITIVSGFARATYRIRWYRQNGGTQETLSEQNIKVDKTNASDLFVCPGNDLPTGIDNPNAGIEACRLDPSKFQKGWVVGVAAAVVEDDFGAVGGQFTETPFEIQICDAYPQCQQFEIGFVEDSPAGVEGVLECKAMCRDADGDGVVADVKFINESQLVGGDGKNVSVAITEPAFESGVSFFEVSVPLDLTEEDFKDFASRLDAVTCEMNPYGLAQAAAWEADPNYPYTNDLSLAEASPLKEYNRPDDQETIPNTLPLVQEPVILTDPSDLLPTTAFEFRCDIDGKVFDPDIEDQNLIVEYSWVNGSNNDALIGSPIQEPYTQDVPNTTNVAKTKLVPGEIGGISAGESLCCQVRAWEADITVGTKPAAFQAEKCVTLSNSPPQVGPPDTGGGPPQAPTIKISLSDSSPTDVLCAPDSLPDPGVNSYYSWQRLRCEHDATLVDPDSPGDSSGLYWEYEWYVCDPGGGNYIGGEPFFTRTDLDLGPQTPGILPAKAHVCCVARPCDSVECGEPLAMPNNFAVFIADTPPNFDEPAVEPKNPDAELSKDALFTCAGNAYDCDLAVPGINPDGSIDAQYKWYAVTEIPGGDPIEQLLTGAEDDPDISFPADTFACGEELACRLSAFVDGSANDGPLSDSITLDNNTPTFNQLTINSVDSSVAVTPTSNVVCEWNGITDLDGDSIETVVVRWYKGGVVGGAPQEIGSPVTLVGSDAKTQTQATIDLGTCGLPTLAQPGDQLSCSIEVCDGCDCSPEKWSYEAPFGSTVTVGDLESPVTKKAGETFVELKAGSTALTQIDKFQPFKCEINAGALEFCNTNTSDFLYLHALIGPGGEVLIPEGSPGPTLSRDLELNFCPPIDVSLAWCEAKVVDPDTFAVYAQGTSTTVPIDENPPTVNATLSPETGSVGTTLTCDFEADDLDAEDIDSLDVTVEWYRDGTEALTEFQGNTELLLAEGFFSKGDTIRCQVSVDDGCFPVVTDISNTVVLSNSTPTVDPPVLTPGEPLIGSILICTVNVDTYADPDGDVPADFEFTWQISGPGIGPEPLVLDEKINSCAKELVNISDESVEGQLWLEDCNELGTIITKGQTVSCSVTPQDATAKATGGGTAIESNAVTILDTPPQFDEEPTLVPLSGSLPSAPTLTPGQDILVCTASATDADAGAGDVPNLIYEWELLDEFGGLKETYSVSNEQITISDVFSSVGPCDEVRCIVRLYDGPIGPGELPADSASLTSKIGDGGSVYFDGTPGAFVSIDPQLPIGVPAPDSSPGSGLLELWYFPEAFPNSDTRHVLAYGVEEPGSPQPWEISVLPTGELQARRDGIVPTLAGGVDWPTLQAGQWNYIALGWSAVQGFIQLDNQPKAAFSGTVSVDLIDLRLGSPTLPPRGWVDEMRFRNAQVATTPGEDFFQDDSPAVLAVYHFDLNKTGEPLDTGAGGFQFHGKLEGAPKPQASYHVKQSTCGFSTCGGLDTCPPLVPSQVVVELDEDAVPLNGSSPVTTYPITCTASGSFDPEGGGQVTTYEYEWINTANGAIVGAATGSISSTDFDINGGCLSLACRATPIGNTTGLLGPPGTSTPVLLCKGGGQPLYGFACNDNEPCSTDVADSVLGCEHSLEVGATCSPPGGSCPGENEPQCQENVPGAFSCECIDPCPDDPTLPCTISLPNPSTGICETVANSDLTGQPCDPTFENACAPPGASGLCSSIGACQLQGSEINCDDGNPCTDDDCDPAAVDDDDGCINLPNTDGCTDGDACTVGDFCQDALCTSGNPVACNDGNECTSDSCNSAFVGEGTAACEFTVNIGDPCSDGTACTDSDLCNAAGICVGSAITCNDNEICTNDSCNPLTGCVFTNVSQFEFKPCSDGNECTEGDTCGSGVCQPGEGPDCDDGNQCTTDTCNVASGCVSFPIPGEACDDGNVCTTPGACTAGGECQVSQVVCDDGNPCTSDSCSQGAGGCQFSPLPDAVACPDGDFCTINEQCEGGLCTSDPNPCDDGNQCTLDSCLPTGCDNVNAVGTTCTDGSACTEDDFCSSGFCVPGEDVTCDGEGECTTEACIPETGCSGVVEPKTAPCSDGSACTVNDTCVAGACEPGAPLDCDDGKVCTNDSCLPGSGCTTTPISGIPCDDNNECTNNDACSSGVCIGASALDCNDDNPCTTDVCTIADGCTYTDLVGTPCEDGNPCTVGDSCFGGSCASGGGVLDCEGDNECLIYDCNPASESGCFSTPKSNGTTCSDGDPCSGGDNCVAGACVPTTVAIECDDDNPCTTETCVLGEGCQFFDNSDPCDDGDPCSENDGCAGGSCVPGTAKDCDDSNACTNDACNSSVVGGCVNAPNTDSCDDGDACTENDQCLLGACNGNPVTCDDSNDCTDDQCDSGSGCEFPNNTDPCEDGDLCTVGDVCDTGTCVAGPTTNCSDGNDCTADVCDSATGFCSNPPEPVDTECDDGSDCSFGDVCDGSGSCSGELSWCCQEAAGGAAIGECNFSDELNLATSSIAVTYDAPTCGIGAAGFSQDVVCVSSAAATPEVCLQFDGPDSELAAMVLPDVEPGPTVDECVAPLTVGGCTPIDVTSFGVENYQIAVHELLSTSFTEKTRLHVRCPTAPVDCNIQSPMLCESPRTCQTTANWPNNNFEDYGSCGTGLAGRERSFRFPAATDTDHVVWLSGAAAENATVLVTPGNSSGACNSGLAGACFESGQAPLVFNSGDNENICIFVELPVDVDPSEVTISVSCF